jgi:epoxyqueuosine reductase
LDYGSWIFLGEIVIDKELRYDAPIKDYCGSCQACIQACPTNAIVAPYVLDAGKCISYLTIENRDDPIPEHLGREFKQWIFGCDICQDVCPWNKFKQITKEGRFFPKQGNVDPDLKEWIIMDEMEFKMKFKKSPVIRPGWVNFIRNIKAAFPKSGQ